MTVCDGRVCGECVGSVWDYGRVVLGCGETQGTLSSMVSNLVRTIPSMVRSVPSSEWSTSASLNLASWSTASLPTSASPTNKTRSGAFTLIS